MLTSAKSNTSSYQMATESNLTLRGTNTCFGIRYVMWLYHSIFRNLNRIYSQRWCYASLAVIESVPAVIFISCVGTRRLYNLTYHYPLIKPQSSVRYNFKLFLTLLAITLVTYISIETDSKCTRAEVILERFIRGMIQECRFV